MSERYFTERLFWLPDTDELLHVYFAYGHGWYSCEGFEGFFGYKSPTYTSLMQRYNHRDPQLLLQEEG
jgi:hypothetical protein